MAIKEERHYMVPFFAREGLPYHLRHWQRTVDDMLAGVRTDHSDRPIYFMSDTRFVKAGEAHRRLGVHVDGYWHPDVKAHGGRGSHRGYGGHGGGSGRHRGRGGHGGSHMSGGWGHCGFSEPEALILASNFTSSCAYLGEYDLSEIGEGGSCPQLDTARLERLPLSAYKVYAGTVGTLHESFPVPLDCYRTVVRLNCPGVSVN